MAAILGAISVITAVESLTILMLLVCYIHYIKYCLNMLKNNHNEFQKIYNHLWLWLCYGGHLGRHFENDSFPDVGFQGTFSMLFMISSTIQIRWKTFCIINWKIYNHLQAMAAILDAILKIIAFPM